MIYQFFGNYTGNLRLLSKVLARWDICLGTRGEYFHVRLSFASMQNTVPKQTSHH